jgi:hypothetical protein
MQKIHNTNLNITWQDKIFNHDDMEDEFLGVVIEDNKITIQLDKEHITMTHKNFEDLTALFNKYKLTNKENDN